MEQSNIFDVLYKTYKPKNKIKLIELFAGIGSQSKALEYLGLDFETHKIVEWAIPSIIAYYEMHSKDKKDYSKDLSKEEICDFLFEKGVSKDYNEPATIAQIKIIKEETLRECYNAIKATNNLVNIMSTKGSDLEIENSDEYEYIMTYSFPCQDLSLAGNRKGMARDGNTRSGLLWQIEIILKELCGYRDHRKKPNRTKIHSLAKWVDDFNFDIDKKKLPQILLMENVPQVIGKKNINDFNEWQLFLEKLGYSNYTQNLIATDYGIPQIRNRTFMISILGDYSYNFPKKMELKYKLKDFLEKEVDQSYYLSDKAINGITKTNFQSAKLENRIEKNGVIPTLLARDYKDPKLVIEYQGTYNFSASDNFMNGRDRFKKDKETIERILTQPKVGVVEYGSYYTWEDKQGNINTQCNRAANEEKNALTIACSETGKVFENKTRIRKLTPKECFRLMGFLDKNYDKLKLSKNQKYHIAGDSIVVTVLMAIFGKLFNVDYETKINELVEKLKENK